MDNQLILLLTNPLFYLILAVILGGIAGLFGFFLGLNALIEVRALQKSTHNIQYIPIDPKVDQENDDFLKKWATGNEVIKEQEKMFQENLEEEMPEFLLDEEDKKKYSF